MNGNRPGSENHVLVRAGVGIAVLASIIGAFIGSGAAGGTPISEAAGGWLSTGATPLAPDTAAFRVWSIIYVGLIGYGLWQFSASARTSGRQRNLRPWAIASALLNALWVWTIQWDTLSLSVVVIAVLLLVLIRMLLLISAERPRSRMEAVLTDGTFGLYLGWVSVATAANIAAWLGALGAEGFSAWVPAAVAVLVVIAVLGVSLAGWTRGRIAPALTIAWGLSWISVARTDGDFASDALVWTAGLSAAAVLSAAVLLRWKFRAHHALGGSRTASAFRRRDSRK